MRETASNRLGPYELVRKLAAGGMAELFLARYRTAGGFFRDVVLKRLFRNFAEDERMVRMFQDEARLLSQFSHPNIPQAYDLGRADGTWYFAMEYVQGTDLADLWRAGAKSNTVMPLPVALGIVLQTCDALHHAHERTDRAGRALNVVHRDVTPQNVMITRDGVVKLLDFGVAQTAARRDTDAGALRGTFAYMAPEQVRARPLDRRSDVFALGVILYELTTGTRLFRGSDVQIMTAIVEDDVPLPSSRVADYPAALESIVLGTLVRDREHRTATAYDLAWQLESFALASGLLTGPRAIADYVQSVLPAEPVVEEDLALVTSSGDVASSQVTSVEAVPQVHADEDGATAEHGDLAAAAAAAASELDPDPDANTVPPPPPAHPYDESAHLAEAAGVPETGFEEIPTDAPLRHRDTDAAAVFRPPPRDSDEVELDDAEPNRPIVLLARPKRRSRPPGGGDYVQELIRRLDDEPDDEL